MCNLYHVAPENTLDSYIRRHLGTVKLPEQYPPKPTVGPFDTGIFMTADDNGGLIGRPGQWGMIRSGQRERIEYKERPPAKPGGKPRRDPMLKNNARVETVATSPERRPALTDPTEGCQSSCFARSLGDAFEPSNLRPKNRGRDTPLLMDTSLPSRQ